MIRCIIGLEHMFKFGNKFFIHFLVSLFDAPKERQLTIPISTDRATMVNDIPY